MNNPSPSSIPLDDPRYPIFGRLFMCRVPRIAQYGTDYLKTYGIPTSGYKDVDLGLITKPELCYITINQMVEFYNDNQMVSIVKQDDVRIIYEICQDYTFDWAKRIKDNVYIHTAPLEDLVKIDEFSEAVYQYAGHTYGNEYAKTFLPDFGGKAISDEIQSLMNMYDSIDNKKKKLKEKKFADVTVKTKFSTETKKIVETIKEKIELPDRPSVRDIFLNYMRQ